jgi:Maltokinase N-terminal cap domain
MRFVAKVHPGATLTPEFRWFVPRWVARQPWYAGDATPELRPVGFFRFEDPDGEVGIETHVLTDGNAIYQIPMTYRRAPLPGVAEAALISVSEHSVLGTRWIYDATADPVWRAALLRLIRSGGCSDPSMKKGAIGPVTARGQLLAATGFDDKLAVIDLRRMLTGNDPEDLAGSVGADAAGVVHGTWRTSPEAAPVTGILAIVRAGWAHDS